MFSWRSKENSWVYLYKFANVPKKLSLLSIVILLLIPLQVIFSSGGSDTGGSIQSWMFYLIVMGIFAYYLGFLGSGMVFIFSILSGFIELNLLVEKVNSSWEIRSLIWDYLFRGLFLLIMAVMLGWFGFCLDTLKRKLKLADNEIEAMGLEDPLTGLPNERFFFEKLDLEIIKAKEKKNSFNLIYFDLHSYYSLYENPLKIGYEDLALEIGLQLKKNLKPRDFICRINPEAFIVCLVDSPEDKALEAFQKIKRILANSLGIIKCVHEDLDLSMGYLTFPKDGSTCGEILQGVHRRLNKNKEAIRIVYEERMRRSEKFAVIGQLSAGLAHEIRNPLTSVRGFIQLLQSKNHGKPNPEYIEIIMSELDRVNKLMKEFLDLAKPIPAKKDKINLKDILERAVFFMNSECNLRDVYIQADIEPNLCPLWLDKEQIMQVLINLIHNAIDSMPKGGRIDLIAREVNGYISCIVKDTGEGIKPEDLEKIFEPFHSTKEEGTGLGLAITRRILQNHDTRIAVMSELGKGTTFTLLFPKIVE